MSKQDKLIKVFSFLMELLDEDEVKPDEVKPDEVKPDEVKPDEVKPKIVDFFKNTRKHFTDITKKLGDIDEENAKKIADYRNIIKSDVDLDDKLVKFGNDGYDENVKFKVDDTLDSVYVTNESNLLNLKESKLPKPVIEAIKRNTSEVNLLTGADAINLIKETNKNIK